MREPQPLSRLPPLQLTLVSLFACPQLDVYLFLFSDVLLVTKTLRRADKAKVIRPPLMLEKLVCRPLRDPSMSLLGGTFPSPFPSAGEGEVGKGIR